MSKEKPQQILDRYRVRVSGNGGQTILLGHGMGTDGNAWVRQRPVLESAGYQVNTFEFAGATSTTQYSESADMNRALPGCLRDV